MILEDLEKALTASQRAKIIKDIIKRLGRYRKAVEKAGDTTLRQIDNVVDYADSDQLAKLLESASPKLSDNTLQALQRIDELIELLKGML